MMTHTVQRIAKGANKGRYIYACGNDRGWLPECCEAQTWEDPGLGHDTEAEAYAHMRAKLLGRLRLDAYSSQWAGCRAPVGGGRCDVPTKHRAEIPPMHFLEPLCDTHRTQEVVEAMWDGPGDSLGSW